MFTEYGKLAIEKNIQKPFQKLLFLVRDFQHPNDYAYGAAGGKAYLQKKLSIDDTKPEELKDLRRTINSYFEKVDCFLMPHPGKKILQPNFNGKIKGN